LLAILSASSKSGLDHASTGPKISSWLIVPFGSTSAMTVGGQKNHRRPLCFPGNKPSPSLTPLSMYARIFSCELLLTTGPCNSSCRRHLHCQQVHLARDEIDELVVHLFVHDGAGTCGAFLPWKPKADTNTPCAASRDSLLIHNDGVFSTHLCHHPLQPDLSRLHFRRSLVNVNANLLGPGKGNEARLWMHTRVSPTAPPGPETKFTTPPGRPASVMISMNFHPVSGESLEGFRTTCCR